MSRRAPRSARRTSARAARRIRGPARARAAPGILSRGFPPVAGDAPRILILGSLPGQRSLAEHQYYAQSQNAFWKIMGRLVGAGPDCPYDERLVRLKAASIALWDVLAAGERAGSLDSAIVKSTIVVNDFPALLGDARGLERICFNGRTAAGLYLKHVVPTLDAKAASLPAITLPSTSPAHAAMSFDEKLARWAVALEPVLR